MPSKHDVKAPLAGGNRFAFFRPWSLVPVLLTALIVILFTLQNWSLRVYEPAWLFPSLTVLFNTLIPYMIAVLAASVYLRRGLSSALMLGAALVAFGTAALCSSIAMTVLSLNSSVTVYNFGRLLASGLFLYSVIRITKGESPVAVATGGSPGRLSAFYGISLLLMPLVTVLAQLGVLPVFFVQGEGPTAVRQLVLDLSKVLFAISAAFLLLRYYRIRQPFAWWFALGLVLLLIGAIGVFYERAVGSPVSWTGRLATYLGCFYLLIAVITLYRQARLASVSVEYSLAEFLTGSKALFELLVENSPDVITRIDRELRYRYINPAIELFTGFPPSFFAGKRIGEVGINQENGRKMKRAAESVLGGSPGESVILDFNTPDGWKSFDCRYYPEKDPLGRVVGVLGISRDITSLLESRHQLAQSEEKFSRVFSTNPSFIIVSTLLEGLVLEANEACEKIFGYSREEFVGRNSLELGLWADPEQRKHLTELLLGPGSFQEHEVIVRTKSGEMKTILLSAEVALFGGTKCIISAGLDITERKRAEEALRESEKLLSSVLGVLPVGVFIADRTGNIIWTNDAAKRIWGGEKRTGLEGYREYKGWRPGSDKPLEPHEWGMARALLKGEEALNEEVEIEGFDGSRKIIYNTALPVRDENGEIIAGVTINEDITERKLAEYALRTSEERYRALFETNHDAVLVGLPAPENRILLANPAACRMFGMREKELEGADSSTLLDTSDPRLPEFVEQRKRHGRAAGELRMRRKDGAFFPAYLTTTLFADASGRQILSSVIRDVTGQKRYEAELQAAKAEAEARAAEAQNANLAKSRFLSHMSHELRTPINGIMGMNHLARLKAMDPEVRDYLDYAHVSAEHLLEVINNVLDLSKIEAGKVELRRESFDLPALLDSVIAPFQLQAEQKGLAFLTDLDPGLPDQAVGDPGRLRQVLYNLLGNAVKFTMSGEVELSVCQEDLSSQAARVLFSVRDTGIGIPPDRLERIFESFERINTPIYSSYGGTGLGLFISRQLVELMNGFLIAESSEGEGSVFYFSIPFEVAAAKVPVKEPATELEFEPAAELRILLAEDEVINRMFLQNLLLQQGHTVEAVDNGKEALDKLAAGRFDLVLMDVSMPVMGGEEALREIRSGNIAGVDPAVRVIALTAHAIQGDRERFLNEGFDGYLSKPVNLGKLQELLDSRQTRELS